MKKIITLFFIFCLFNSVFVVAQSDKKNTIYIVGTPNAVIYDTKSDFVGGPSYDGKMGYGLGLEYEREFMENFSIVAGMHYAYNNIHSESLSSSGPQLPIIHRSFRRKLITFPLQLKYTFGKYFFVNTGGLLNFQRDREYKAAKGKTESKIKAKLGVIVGIGAKLDFKDNYCFIVNPYFQTNDLSSQRHVNFYNVGVKVGLGYKF